MLSQKPQQNLLCEGHKGVQVPLHPRHLVLQARLQEYKTRMSGSLIPRLSEAGLGMRLGGGCGQPLQYLKSNDDRKSLREGPLCLQYNRGHFHTHAGREDKPFTEVSHNSILIPFAETKMSTSLMVLLSLLPKLFEEPLVCSPERSPQTCYYF